MTSDAPNTDLEHEIYPATYFDLSQTWYRWNRLTIRALHDLRQQPGFGGQQVWFHLNHPIRFVSLTGLAIQIELGGGASAAKFCFITLDDGSGNILNIKIRRRLPAETGDMEFPSNTEVDSLDVEVKFGLPSLHVDKQKLDVGQCIHVQGTVDSYRGVKQLELKRIRLVFTTAVELEYWEKTARWMRDVLSKPWILTEAQRTEEDLKIQAEIEGDRKYQSRKRAWHARKAARQQIDDDLAAEELATRTAFFDSGALPGSEVIKLPWQ